MYQFSRSIYRELSPRINEDPEGSARQDVLSACEATIRRLAYDRRYFARPARTLFTEIREHFRLSDQVYVYRAIERKLDLAAEFMEKHPELVGLDRARECRASTRKGTPCKREPLPGRDYCPSHKHLEEVFEAPEVIAA